MKTVDREAKLHLMTSETSKEMYDTLVRMYEKDTEQEKCLLLQKFYNFKFDNSKDVHYNFSKMQNIVYQLKLVDEEVSENMFMSKVLTVLPEKYKHFSTAWDSTPKTDKTIEKLIQSFGRR